MEFKELPLIEIVSLIKSKEVSQKEVWDYFQKRITDLDPQVQAFNHVSSDFQEKDLSTPLAGLPMAVKDLYNEKGVPTTAASKMLENYISPYESSVTHKLKDAGMNSLGKVNCDEFAMGTTGENSAIRTTVNPWDSTRVPGGSSSGSAASVAAGLAPAALGTDTGGSIRQPAALSGVVGFKGTYGRVSRYGVIPMASSLDTMGVIAKNVRDTAYVWEQMVGQDPLDSTSLSEELSLDESLWKAEDLKGMKIGIPKEYYGEGIEEGTRSEIEKAIKTMEGLGAEIQEVSLPMTDYALAAYYIIVPSEVSTNLARYDGVRFGHTTKENFSDYGEFISKTRSEGFGPEAMRRSMLGAFTLSAGFYDAYYKKASMVRQMLRDEFAQVFEKVDVLVTPVSPMVSWKIGELADDPLALYLADVFTVPGAITGIPGLSLPCGFAAPKDDPDAKLPVGLQIMGPRLGEEKIFKVGHVFEQAIKDEISAFSPEIF